MSTGAGKNWIAVALLLGALAASGGRPAQAATVIKVDVALATKLSEWVVRAKVVSLASVDLRKRGDSIYTDVTLAIETVYRGKNVPQTYVMRLMGGLGDDGLALAVPGMPDFKPGDDVVLFLEKVGHGHVPCGLGQGVWRVTPGPLGYPIVHRDLGGLAIMTRTADGKLAEVPAAPQGVKLLVQLVQEIAAQPRQTEP